MAIQLTKEQQRVIDVRNTEVIVSAGAGAGKTSVLVERVINLITDESLNINIDDLLIVTFTNEASNVMKEKIYTALNKKLGEDPNNENVIRQIYALNKANISTIHGFCQKVIEKNSNKLNIDPKFRVASQDEVYLVKSEVFDNVIEEFYEDSEKCDKTFHKLVNCFISKVNDEPFKNAFFDIYNKAYNNPNPIKWVEDSVNSYNVTTLEDVFKTDDFNVFINDLISFVRKKQELENKYRFYFQDEEQKKVAEAYSYFKEDAEYIEFFNKYDIVTTKNYKEFFREFLTITDFPKIESRSHKMEDDLKEKYNSFKSRRDELLEEGEKSVKTIQLLLIDDNVFLEIYINMFLYMSEFFKFFKAFDLAYQKRKVVLKFIDFNDMEQLTLQILLNEDYSPSETCEYYKNKFAEVIVDEYQDCNYTQETIFKAISNNGDNMFMVGDIKQSIYKFRGAKPDIFKSKLNTTNSNREVINLNKNFRSEKNILHFVNEIFTKVMKEESGNINYDENHLLNLGKEDAINGKVEVLLGHGYPAVDAKVCDFLKTSFENTSDIHITEEDIINKFKSGKKLKVAERKQVAEKVMTAIEKNKGLDLHSILDELGSTIDERDFENEIVARKILDIKSKSEYDYKDIVILFRSKNAMKDMSETLKRYDIPSIFDEKENLFNTFEIQSCTNFLKIIDNKIQDIPLISVLKLPIYDFTEKEMLFLKNNYDTTYFFRNLVSYFEEKTNLTIGDIIQGTCNIELQEDDKLLHKTYRFLEDYYYFKSIYKKMGISDLIIHYLQYTNLEFYIQNYENGGVKSSNLHILIEYAKAFEKTSYSSIFNFIKFIEKQEKNEEVQIETASSNVDQNAVRMMTIHASKGLEFNVVFLCNINKTFNTMDLKKKYVSENKFSFKYKDYENKYLVETIPFINIKNKIVQEILAEELRTLYVALTRPEKELYITYVTTDIDKDEKKWVALNEKFSLFEYDKVNSYSDIIMPIVYSKDDAYLSNIYNLQNMDIDNKPQDDNEAPENITYSIKDYFFDYKYQRDNIVPVDIAVTKLLYMEEVEEKREFITSEKEDEVYKSLSFKKPDFVERKQVKKGTEFGTLIHKVFWLIPFNKSYSSSELGDLLLDLTEKGAILQYEYDTLIKHIDDIYSFFNSSIYDKILKASKIYKEKPFVSLIEGGKYFEKSFDDKVLLKGVIDLVYFYEDEIYILDFKTDYNKDKMMDKYSKQLEYYSNVLEKTFGKKVAGKYLYFTSHNEIVEI